MTADLKKDDLIVWRSPGFDNYETGSIVKTTALYAFVHEKGRGWADRRVERHNILFCGTAGQCDRLIEKLVSSKALMVEEQKNAARRHEKRIAKIVEEAS